MNDSNRAWLASSWLPGRSQKDVAEECGLSPAVVCCAIKQFCEKWGGGTDLVYNEDRRKLALIALRNYFLQTEGRMEPLIAEPLLAFTDAQYANARREHAWLMRAEGMTLKAIGERFGVSKERARGLVAQFGRKTQWATRRAQWSYLPENRKSQEMTHA